jgi:RNA polymerase primary sigma factor
MGKKFINYDTDESTLKYFKEIRKIKLINKDEEIELAKKIKNGDVSAIDKLVTANLKFVVSIAKVYQGKGLPLSDLINEGNFGLIKAAAKFDYTKGFRFISYAVWWIKQSIIHSLNENARIVRLPANVINKLSVLSKEISKFENENERKPIYGELVDKNNEIIEIMSNVTSMSLNEVINEDGDEFIDILESYEVEDRIVIDTKIKTEIETVLSKLDDREKQIIEAYFGINTECEPMTLEAIGEKFSLTKERIRQIKEKAIRKLRYNADNLFYLKDEI